MKTLEGRKLDKAILDAFGPLESSVDSLRSDRPCYEDGMLKVHQSDELTWKIVDTLLAKGWMILQLRQPLHCDDSRCVFSLQDRAIVVGAMHTNRNTAILNACLRAKEAKGA